MREQQPLPRFLPIRFGERRLHQQNRPPQIAAPASPAFPAIGRYDDAVLDFSAKPPEEDSLTATKESVKEEYSPSKPRLI